MSEDIQVRMQGGVGQIVLDRPQSLNALTLPMIRAIRAALEAWRHDDTVRMVLLKGNGKAFCAGGDVVATRAAALAGQRDRIHAFFSEEYALNYAIHAYPKPWLSLIDGICMGGGMGLSVHGGYRVVSERAVMAMPETAIGFFPDVGSSYFLSRLPGSLGLYLGLTGKRITAADALYCGLATHFVPSTALGELEAALTGQEDDVAAILRRFHRDPGPSVLAAHRGRIDRDFRDGSAETIIDAFTHGTLQWEGETLAALRAASPRSLRITAELIRWAAGRDLRACLDREFDLAMSVSGSHDFAEGVRAMLIDKDRTPVWTDGPDDGIGGRRPRD